MEARSLCLPLPQASGKPLTHIAAVVDVADARCREPERLCVEARRALSPRHVPRPAPAGRVTPGTPAALPPLQENAATRQGVAHTPKGLWPKFNGGKSINATVAERDADMGRGAVFHDNRVFISPV